MNTVPHVFYLPYRSWIFFAVFCMYMQTPDISICSSCIPLFFLYCILELKCLLSIQPVSIYSFSNMLYIIPTWIFQLVSMHLIINLTSALSALPTKSRCFQCSLLMFFSAISYILFHCKHCNIFLHLKLSFVEFFQSWLKVSRLQCPRTWTETKCCKILPVTIKGYIRTIEERRQFFSFKKDSAKKVSNNKIYTISHFLPLTEKKPHYLCSDFMQIQMLWQWI